uniref:Phospholipase n=1 Tax=Trichuris muris TaxID=70415 RepID=A0A5S6QA67_TRIMR
MQADVLKQAVVKRIIHVFAQGVCCQTGMLDWQIALFDKVSEELSVQMLQIEMSNEAKPTIQYVVDRPADKWSHSFRSLYENLQDKQNPDYFIPSTPIFAKVSRAEEDGTNRGYNPFHVSVYTVELEHGNHYWTVHRRFRDFFSLHNHILLYKAKRNLIPRRKATTVGESENKLVWTSGINQTDQPAQVNVLCSRETIQDPGLPQWIGKRCSTLTHGTLEKLRPESQSSDGFGSVGHSIDSAGSISHRSSNSSSNDYDGDLPPFPVWPNIFHDRSDQRTEKLNRYLNAVLQNVEYRNLKETREFIEVSRFSFVSGLGLKRKEGMLKKRPGGRQAYGGVVRCCTEMFASWRYRWFLLKDTYLAYADPERGDVRAVMLFDPGFHVKLEERKRPRLTVENLSRTLVIKCKTKEDAVAWERAISATVKYPGSEFLQSNAHGSTFPIRINTYGMWFVDGKDFMENVANMIELAEEEIFITDWWLSPEIYLKRPAIEGRRWRLDELLKRKAEQGVHIYVLLYKEVQIALGIKSLYSKRRLKELHPNIHVLRHPDHLPGSGVFLWAHHEKIVVIDQNIAFVGGIDLCYGRWDDSEHRLTDFGSVTFAAKKTTTIIETDDKSILSAFRSVSRMLPVVSMRGASEEVNNIGELDNVEVAQTSSVMRDVDPTQAQPGVTTSETVIRLRFKRPSIFSSSRFHFQNISDLMAKYKKRAESKSESESDRKPDSTNAPAPKRSVFMKMHPWQKLRRALKEGSLKPEEFDEAAKYYEERLATLQQEDDLDSGLLGGGKYWIGKDYVNFIFKDFTAIDLPYNDFIDRRETPRMPWHDIASVFFSTVARDVGRHFIERWNACKTEKNKYDKKLPYLIPKTYERTRVPQMFRNISHKCHVQVLRSACPWSVGNNMMEASIHRAYVGLIENAKHYIYIENQFFVTMLNRTDVQNSIAKALYDRIVQAHKKNEAFRVYVLLPLLPGFEGQVGTTGGSALQAVLYWTYQSLSKGPHSLLGNLSRDIEDPSQYIVFCSLRTHDVLMGKMVTELIYIHSKLMIVDDRWTIIGSANINDRSMLGKRDSEVAVLVEDAEYERSVMNGEDYFAGKFARSLRQRLFFEHLGLYKQNAPIIDISDPSSERFFSLWKGIARKNTDIYEKVFCCIPTDEAQTFEQMKQYKGRLRLCDYDEASAKALLDDLTGNLVLFPLRFLYHSDLSPSHMTKEGLAPTSLFT